MKYITMSLLKPEKKPWFSKKSLSPGNITPGSLCAINGNWALHIST